MSHERAPGEPTHTERQLSAGPLLLHRSLLHAGLREVSSVHLAERMTVRPLPPNSPTHSTVRGGSTKVPPVLMSGRTTTGIATAHCLLSASGWAFIANGMSLHYH